MPLQIITKLPPLLSRPIEGHKGTFGRVLVVGGSDDMVGAPVLAGTAALRMGSGLVQIAVPRAILYACLSVTPELIGLSLGKSTASKPLVEAADKADSIVVGPGMGRSAEAKSRLMRLIQLDKPMVIDADALNLLSAERRWPARFKARAVLTPHPGEMKRLANLFGKSEVPTDDAGRLDIAAKAARSFKQIVVLKGTRTVVTDGQLVYINTTGDSSLSKAGTGDVLCGVLGCLLGQEIDPFDAAILAVHIHGLAGELAGKALGRRSVLARDVIDHLSPAIVEMEGG